MNEWVGRVGATTKVMTLTATGVGSGAGTLNVTVGPKVVGVAVANTMTAAAFAANLYAALSGSLEPEVLEANYTYTTAGTVVTVTVRTAGQDVEVMAAGAVTNNGITLTPATAAAATGPNDAANPVNWSLGHLPAAGEQTVVRGGPDILFGVGTAFADCNDLEILPSWTPGNLGLPDRNANGYYEYRAKRAVVKAAADVKVRGGGRVRLDFAGAGGKVTVTGTGGPTDTGELGAVDVDTASDLAALTVTGGSVQFNRDGGGGKPGAVHVSAGTLTLSNVTDLDADVLDVDGGQVTAELTASTGVVAVAGGTVRLTGATALPKITMTGGTLLAEWTQAAALDLRCSAGGGNNSAPEFDARNCPGKITLAATAYFRGGAKLTDPGNQVVSDPDGNTFDAASLSASDLGGELLVIR